MINLLEERLKELRKKNHYSQREISEKLGIAQTTYAGYEAGRHEPNIKMLKAIAELYGISVDYLIGRY